MIGENDRVNYEYIKTAELERIICEGLARSASELLEMDPDMEYPEAMDRAKESFSEWVDQMVDDYWDDIVLRLDELRE